MITESVPLIYYPIKEPVPSSFSPKSKCILLEPAVSGSILVIDPRGAYILAPDSRIVSSLRSGVDEITLHRCVSKYDT